MSALRAPESRNTGAALGLDPASTVICDAGCPCCAALPPGNPRSSRNPQGMAKIGAVEGFCGCWTRYTPGGNTTAGCAANTPPSIVAAQAAAMALEMAAVSSVAPSPLAL